MASLPDAIRSAAAMTPHAWPDLRRRLRQLADRHDVTPAVAGELDETARFIDWMDAHPFFVRDWPEMQAILGNIARRAEAEAEKASDA